MKDGVSKASGYRWVVLAVFMLLTAVNQLAWITFAPITGEAAAFYGTSDLVIGLLSLVFMAVYVVMFLPAAWAIDTWGFRPAVGIGAVLTAVGCLARGLFAANLALVFAAQLAIAVGQPFVLGAITKLAARWFPLGERATASGLGTLSIYLGILGGIMATPLLVHRLGMRGMLMAWGILAVAAAAAFLALARERPRTPVGTPAEEARALMFDGLRSMLHRKDFILLAVIFFVGLGVFNSVTTWIEAIVRPRGFDSSQAGMAGGLMLIGGIIGAAVVPLISDAMRRRKPFIVLALAGLIPGLAGVTFARGYGLLLASSFAFGFFLLSSGPIGFQYGAEITLPAPEGTSNSLLILMGQISAIVFIFAMDALKAADGSMTASLVVLIGLMTACVLLSLFLGESPIANQGLRKPAAGAPSAG
jgi:cyanate permease